MISVVIPLYNKEKQIANTLQTVLNQTFQDFEIVIVNDGSTDNSVVEIEKIKDSRIRIIHQKNAGVSAARNRGIEEAKYDLIALLDADDEWKPKYLETQYHLSIKYPECSIFIVNYEFKDTSGNITNTVIKNLPFTGVDGILLNYFEVASCSTPPICSITIMLKKDIIKNVGGFPLGVTSGEDLVTWAKLAYAGKIAYSKRILATYIIPSKPTKGNEPKDLQTTNDYVGLSLEKLYVEASKDKKRSISKYISYWYKMRSSINLDLGHKIPAFKCAIKSLRFNPLNWKVYIFCILSLLPNFIVSRLIYKYRRL